MRTKSTFLVTVIAFLFGISANCLAVSYEISFVASGGDAQLESVQVQNLRNGTMVSVPAGGVLNLNLVQTALNEVNTSSSGIESIRQLANGATVISYYAKSGGASNIDVYDVSGKKILAESKSVECGSNSFELFLSTGSYILSISGTSYKYTSKIQSTSKSTMQTQLKWLGVSDIAPQKSSNKVKKSEISAISMDYVAGDQLQYTAISGIHKAVVTDVPMSSKRVCFICMTAVPIPAGTFMMGSPNTEVGRKAEEVQHPVTLSAFRMTKNEVTNAQFADFLNSRGVDEYGVWEKAPIYKGQILVTESIEPENYGLHYDLVNAKWIPVAGYENHPAIFVSWFGAVEYATYVGGSLPTEAQWEYACRAGTTTAFNTGDFITDLQANYDWKFPYNGGVNTVNIGVGHCSPVGSFAPNAWGLNDMHGNNNEWCSDWYGAYQTTEVTNPTGLTTGNMRVVRSGNYRRTANFLRSAARNYSSADFMGVGTGFRVVFNQ